MKVIDKREKPKFMEFTEIPVGQCFVDDDGEFNIKVKNYDTENIFAVCLSSGQLWYPATNGEFQIIYPTLEVQ